MKLRRFCVTVLDSWTPTRDFFTLGGAIKHARDTSGANLYWWDGLKYVLIVSKGQPPDAVHGPTIDLKRR